MTKWQKYAAAATLFAAAGIANAACPPLSVYRVSGVTLNDGTLDMAAKILLADTAWHVDASPDASKLRVSLSDVGGPLDKVWAATLREAGGASGYAVASTEDTAACVLHVNVKAIAPPPPTHLNSASAQSYALGSSVATPASERPVLAKPYTLKAHMMLSRELAEYVASKGWTLKWNIPDDYMLDAPFPIPANDDVIAGVSYVVRAYKEQGGLLGATSLFAKPNHVVAIIPTTAAAQEGN